MRVSPQDITRHHHDEPPEGQDPWVPPHAQSPYEIRVSEPDEAWPDSFDRVAGQIRDALGDAALEVHHVGSTSVPGLPAKPVIDVDLVKRPRNAGLSEDPGQRGRRGHRVKAWTRRRGVAS